MTTDEVVGQGLIANEPVSLYRRPGYDQAVIKIFSAGEFVGNVYSWVVDDLGLVWWSIGNGIIVAGYVPHVAGSLTLTAPGTSTGGTVPGGGSTTGGTTIQTVEPTKQAGKFAFTITNKSLIGIAAFFALLIVGTTVAIKLKKAR
jgi:hypothetical protein